MKHFVITSLAALTLFANCKPRDYNSESASNEAAARVKEDGYLLQVFDNGKRAKILLGKELISVGMWERDGTMGSYEMIPKGVYEGRVCNHFRVSNWDPAIEGSTRDNKVRVTWIIPEGTIRQSCSASLRGAEGDYTIGSKVEMKAVKPLDPTRVAYSILTMNYLNNRWNASIAVNGRIVRSGALVKDGSLGGSFTIATQEGDVCGTYRISRWDPSNEGSFRKDQTVGVQWLRPDGSVAKDCAPHYEPAEGDHSGFRNGFLGTYFKSKRDTSTYLWSLDGHGSAKLTLNGTAVFSGSIKPVSGGYEIRQPEGFVCGHYAVKPVTTGAWAFAWVAPDGSVARMCADTLLESTGVYAGSDKMVGNYPPAK